MIEASFGCSRVLRFAAMSSNARLIRSFAALLIALATIGVLSSSAFAARPAKFPWEGPPIRVKPGRLVVVFESGTTPAQRRAIHGDLGGRVTDRGRSPAFDVVDLPPGLTPLAAIRQYEADPSVLSAELDRFAEPTEIPNDEFFATQWGLHNVHQPHPMTETRFNVQNSIQGDADADVDAAEAWDVSTPGADVVVAVLDTGVDVDHPDLANSMWVNQAEQNGTLGVDDDGNGYVDDINGWDFQGNDPNPSPGTNLVGSHGTHVAGIIAAERGNGIGIAGVCGSCRIMGLRFDFSLGQEVQAIQYAVANGADIINMSFVSRVWSPAERAAILAAGNADILTVVAAGNSSLDNDIPTYIQSSFAPAFPASYNLPTILSVAASTHRDRYGLQSECDLVVGPPWPCAFTSWGRDSVDVAAPGVDIVSTVAPGAVGDIQTGYQIWDGTSMAAPLVAGIAGSVKHEHSNYGPLDLKNAVMNSVDHPATLKLLTSWADLTGVSKSPIGGRFTRTQGRVNALGALSAPITNATPLTDGNIGGTKPLARSVRGRVSWPSDVNDVYRRRLVAGNRYRITLNGSVGKDMDLWVWSPSAKEIHQFTAGCFRRGGPCPALKAVAGSLDADEQVTFRVAKTGTFFIQVQGWYSGGAFTLSVRRV
jgi:subtilisin family serine protease